MMSPEPSERPATLIDVALAAGVSRTTASNAFNRPDQLSEALRQHILATAERLGYGGPHPAARMLRTGRCGAIGVVFPDPLPHAFSDAAAIGFLRGVATACEAHGAGLLILPAADPLRVAERVREAAIDGVIVYCTTDNAPVLDAIATRRLPAVAVELGSFAGGPHIRVDDEGGARAAARHLLSLGHRRFAILALELAADGYGGPVDATRIAAAEFAVTLRRLRGFRTALAEAGIEPAAVPIEEIFRNDPQAARTAFAKLLAGDRPPTACLAMSDMLAVGAARAAADAGLELPRDLSITGFDDIPLAAELSPPLTTVRQPLVAKGRLAAERLFGAEGPLIEVLPTELVIRGSTGPAPMAQA